MINDMNLFYLLIPALQLESQSLDVSVAHQQRDLQGPILDREVQSSSPEAGQLL